jgi:hypothetical protein
MTHEIRNRRPKRTARAEFYERRLTFGINYDLFKKKEQKEIPG